MPKSQFVEVILPLPLPKTINVQGLQPGMYVFHARQGHYTEQQVVMVE